MNAKQFFTDMAEAKNEHVHQWEGIGHSICCTSCLDCKLVWGVTTPIVGEPKAHVWEAA